MSDPLYDPRFPDRPQTPDFWRLAETGMQLDGRTTEGGESPLAMTDEVIDMESLMYVAKSRINLMLDGIHMNPSDKIRTAMIAAYVTAVVHGIKFEKAGGHRG